MVLTKEIENSILSLVQEQPRTIQEIALSLDKNWRTIDSYVKQISLERGLIATKTFRGGTRGALKIVYWSALQKTQSSYQEHLAKKILYKTRKEEFSSFDVFQFVEEEKRASTKNNDFVLLAKKQVLVFSGNGSWIDNKRIVEFRKLAEKGVSSKVLLRVDITSVTIVNKLLAINKAVGWDAITIRHAEHPLRGVICDSCVELKETLSPKQTRYRELKRTIVIKYSFCGSWALWLEKVFWKLWDTSIDASLRLKELNKITFS